MSGTAVPTIMIVGDDDSFSYLMQRYVEEGGARALVCPLAPETLALAQRERPAVILLEVSLPETVGQDMLQKFKENELTRDIPVVACSWLEEDAFALVEGAAGHLHKPVLYRDVLAALADAGVSIGRA
jgi:CheY-like chemotaxis protein